MARYEVTNELMEKIDIGVTGVERILQNCRNLLTTKIGEIPYDRYRGFNTSLFDLPFGEMQDALFGECVRVMAWEPDVQVVECEAELTGHREVLIRVTVEVEDVRDEQ